jgi:hypothetical protein
MAKKKFDCKVVSRWDIVLGENETRTVLGTEAQAWSYGKVCSGETSFKVRPSSHRGEVDSRDVLSSFFRLDGSPK